MPKFDCKVGQVFIELSEPPRLVVPDDDNFREHSIKVLIKKEPVKDSFVFVCVDYCVFSEGDEETPPGFIMDAEFTRIGPKCLNNKYNKSDLCNEEISFTNCYEKHYDSAAEYLHRQLTFLLSSWEENGYTNWPFLNYDGTEDLKGFLSEFSPSQLKIFWLKSKQNDVQAQDTKKQMHYEI